MQFNAILAQNVAESYTLIIAALVVLFFVFGLLAFWRSRTSSHKTDLDTDAFCDLELGAPVSRVNSKEALLGDTDDDNLRNTSIDVFHFFYHGGFLGDGCYSPTENLYARFVGEAAGSAEPDLYVYKEKDTPGSLARDNAEFATVLKKFFKPPPCYALRKNYMVPFFLVR